jgi:hypothetical protein
MPGDLIFTGTPQWVGMGRKPQLWLKDRDIVEVGLCSNHRNKSDCMRSREWNELLDDALLEQELVSYKYTDRVNTEVPRTPEILKQIYSLSLCTGILGIAVFR